MSTPERPEDPFGRGQESGNPEDAFGARGPQQATWAPPAQQGQWPAAQPRDTNGKAITALVLGIVGLVFCPLVLSVPAIVFGVIARREVRASQGRETGDGLALAGLL